MNDEQLKRLIREHYPFPIAHAHKKTLGVLDNDLEKLKCLLETAEITIQFLALLTLAQVRQDLLNRSPGLHPCLKEGITSLQQPFDSSFDMAQGDLVQDRLSFAPFDQGNLKDVIDLKNPSFGKWYGLSRDVLKHYRDVKDHLVVPELFDFWFKDSSKKKLPLQPIHTQVVEPLLTLRNDFHHGRVPETSVAGKVTDGLDCLHQLLEALQFLARYELSFTQRILLQQDARQHTAYIHDLTLFNGCLYERSRRQFDMHLQPSAVILLHSREGKHLVLNPFLIFADHLKGPDVFLLNNVARKKAIYISSQFAGEELHTKDEEWKDGIVHHEALSEFFDMLVVSHETFVVRHEAERSAVPVEESIEIEDQERHSAALCDSLQTTAEVFQQKYRAQAHVVQHTSPYKFLDYYNPEDHDIFFGRDREIRLLEQKFHNTRLLVLHGESGTGKTSLIRAGLIPRLDPESYIPVYVRMLKEPLQEIKRELLDQLFVVRHEAERSAVEEERHSTSLRDSLQTEERYSTSLRSLLQTITEQISKTVVIVLDQFEEFFLRFPEEVRQQFEAELVVCIDTPRLDVKFLISLRADYFSYLAAFEDSIPQIFTHQVQLERLNETQALQAVVKPAARLGIPVDEPMVQIKLLPELLSEEGGIEPPLLQIVCDALYQNAQSEGRREIGMTDYEAVGDVKGALGNYLNDKLRQFGKEQRTAKAVLKALVTAEGTKRASFLAELLSRMRSTFVVSHEAERSDVGVAAAKERHSTSLRDSLRTLTEEDLKKDYLDKFVRDRLVRVEEIEGEARYELSHDYLVKHIGAWIEESEREVTKVLEVIDRAYEAYQTTDLLLESSALGMIKPFEDQLILPADKQAFVDRSKTQVRKKRRGLFLKVAVSLLSVALVIGGIFGYQTHQAYLESEQQRKIAIAKQQEAEEQRLIAEQQTEVAKDNLRQAEIHAIEALNQSSKALFPTHDELGALLAGIKAGKKLQQTDMPAVSKYQTVANLQEVVYNIREKNRLEVKGHKHFVESLSFSPDGTLLASGSWDNTITLWHVSDGRKIMTLQGHSEGVSSVVFSPDGTLLASGSENNTIKLWSVSNGSEIATLYGHTAGVSSVTFNPDGTLLASGSWDETIKFWRVTDGKEIMTLQQGHSEAVMSVAFSPDGMLLASGSGNSSPISGSMDNIIKLWDVATGRELMTLQGHVDLVDSIMFSPDGTLLASGSWDETIKLWQVVDGREIATLSGHADDVNDVAFNPDGMLLASGGQDKTIKLWQVADDKELLTLQGHSNVVLSVAFNPDNTLLASGGWDKTIKLWQVADGSEITTLYGHAEGVKSVMFSPDGTLIASGSWDNTVKLWQIADGREIVTLHGHGESVISITFSRDGMLLASGSSDKTIKLWQVTDDKEILTLQGHSEAVLSVAFSPDGTLLASGSGDKTIKLWQVADGREIATLSGHTDRVNDVAFSPDGTLLASGGEDNTIKLWQVADGREIAALYGHGDRVSSVTFSPDGTLIASGSMDDATKLWQVADGREIATLYGHGGGVSSVAFSSDGMLLASGRFDKTIKLWNLDMNDSLVHGCTWLYDYLKNNPNVSKADREICDDIFSEKIAAYQKRVEANPDHADAWNDMGLVLQRQGKLDGATTAFLKQTEVTPDHGSAWYNMGVILQAQGKLDEAVVELKQQTEVKPDHTSAWYKMGVILRIQKKPDEAAAAFQKHIKIAQKQLKLREAIVAYRALLAIKPDHEWTADQKNAWYKMGLALYNPLSEDTFDETLAALRIQVEIKPDHADAWHKLGNILRRLGKLDETAVAYQKLLEIKPDNETAWYDLGKVLWEQDKPNEAVAAYQKQVEVTPDHADAWYDLGYALATQGRLDEAVIAYQQQVTIKPDHERAWFNLGKVLWDQGKLDEAVTVYQKLLEIKPDEKLAHAAWSNLGLLLWKQSKLDEAVAAYQKVLEIKPDDKSAWFNMGNILLWQGKLGEAIAAYQKQVEITPAHKDAWSNMGLALAQQGKLDEAIAAYQEQLAVKPDDKWTWNQLGEVFWDQGKLDEAAKAYADGLNMFPNDLFLLTNDALVALVQNNIPHCQTRIAAALSEVTPKSPLFAILPFLDWLTNPDQGWENILTAIDELDPEVTFKEFPNITPAIERQDEATQQIAQHFIAFIEGKIDRQALKAGLAEHESAPSAPDTSD